MPIACSSAATVCASKRRRKPSLLDRVQSLMERSHPSSGRSATPADIIRNGRPTSFGTGGRHQSECPADIIGIRSRRGSGGKALVDCFEDEAAVEAPGEGAEVAREIFSRDGAV